MRGLMAAVAAMTLAGATTAATAQDWQPAGSERERMLGVDVSSIVVRGDRRGAAVIFAFARPLERADYMIAGVGFDCSAHVMALAGFDFYASDGTLLHTSEEDGREQPIESGSLFQRVEQMVCDGRRDPAGISDHATFAAAARHVLLEDAAR